MIGRADIEESKSNVAMNHTTSNEKVNNRGTTALLCIRALLNNVMKLLGQFQFLSSTIRPSSVKVLSSDMFRPGVVASLMAEIKEDLDMSYTLEGYVAARRTHDMFFRFVTLTPLGALLCFSFTFFLMPRRISESIT